MTQRKLSNPFDIMTAVNINGAFHRLRDTGGITMRFALDQRLADDTLPVISLGLCSLRLMNDTRWPWLVLVPQRPNVSEIFHLTPLDQAMLAFETTLAAETLARVTGCHKINTGSLGNLVPALHVHVVARNPGDPNWPNPVWGYRERVPYRDHDGDRLIDRFRAAF
jgi:diadenosine tetraphosphate (Ap4A) HIT family hydrolase